MWSSVIEVFCTLGSVLVCVCFINKVKLLKLKPLSALIIHRLS